jgi:hypothetical protein
MQNVMNRRWLLASYPEGMPTADNWIMDMHLAQTRWVRGSAEDRAYSVNEETMSSAMAQKLIERLSRWQRKA